MLHFVKMHGLGNDYLYLLGAVPQHAPALARLLTDRHRGIGADGVIYITPPSAPAADFGMRIFNADGSEALMCGNGIRCVGKYVYDRGYTDKTTLLIETPVGNRCLNLHPDAQNPTCISSVTAEMGTAIVDDTQTMNTDHGSICFIPVSVGNPHAVIFTEDAEPFPDSLLAEVSSHPMFPGGVNAECAEILSPTELRMRVYERGSGLTLACGTGACAVCAAAVHHGYCAVDTPITVHLDGGDLTVSVRSDGQILMTGEAVTVFEGTMNDPEIPYS
jgi:diaminopimelate epimerase